MVINTVGVEFDTITPETLLKTFEVQIVVVAEKAGATIIAALHHMGGNIG